MAGSRNRFLSSPRLELLPRSHWPPKRVPAPSAGAVGAAEDADATKECLPAHNRLRRARRFPPRPGSNVRANRVGQVLPLLGVLRIPRSTTSVGPNLPGVLNLRQLARPSWRARVA